MPAFRSTALIMLFAACSSQALAADELKFGPAPAWVVSNSVPATSNAPADAPIATLLADQQISLEPGKITTYSRTAIKIQNGQGLAIGNLSIPWNPATDTVTVHSLVIRRGDQAIDVLAGGQKFQTIRREANLEAAMLDGRLTANIQPEGLQVGDIVDLAATIEHSDPIRKGHVESMFANWNGVPIKAARARLLWPEKIDLKFRSSESLPSLRKSSKNGMNSAEVVLTDADPLLPPKGAPLRFAVGRMVEASDFRSWAEVADLLIPHYKQASVIPAAGPLRDEVERIRKQASDPVKRAEMALDLVQNRVRYVALLMGEGGYVPASAESSWSRRFGDCKAKTALLLAMLHEFGIEAVPAAVNARAGDLLTGRLPMLSLFDHVLVRARIGGKTYWLDGTRTGDVSLDKIAVPGFRWALPLVPNTDLVPLEPPVLTEPNMDTVASIDVSERIYAPGAFKVERVLRGDVAIALKPALANLTPPQLDQSLRDYWRDIYDFVTIKSATYAFDKTKAELKLSMNGEARLEWKDGWFYVPGSGLAYEPDFERAAGPNRDAPWAVAYPAFERTRVSVKLPAGFAPNRSKTVSPVRETLAGVEYVRSASFDNGLFVMEKSERSLKREIPYADAVAAGNRLKALAGEDVYLKVPGGYRVTDKDIQAKAQEKPSSADAFVDRGGIYLDERKYDEAIADFTEAHKLDPKDVWALANRGLAYAWKREFKLAETDLAAAEAIEQDNKVMLRGRALIAEFKGDLAGALAIYDRILTRDSDDNWSRLRRAFTWMRQGKRDDALRDLNTVIEAEPNNAAALAQRAHVMVGKEDWAAAEKDVSASLAADPENALAMATKAMIAMQRSDFETALELADQALKRDPDNHYARSLRAQLLKREKGEQAAMQSFDEAIARAPTDSAALLNRAFAYLETKDFSAADKDVTAALAINPADPWALQARGSVAMARGDYKAAVQAFTAALAGAPADVLAMSRRAEAYRQLGEYRAALADTDAALKAGLASPQLRLQRINILLDQGDVAMAGTEADKLVQENPTSEFAMVAAGRVYSALGTRQKAMDSFDRALAINPVPYIYINRSQVRPAADLEGKLADLDAALKIDPAYEGTLAEKARILSKAGKHSEAIDLYDRAIKSALDPRYLELGRAIALERAGRTTEAAKAFDTERARAKTANDFNTMCWTKAVNDVALQSAVEDCREALRLDPEHRSATDSLGMAFLKLGKLQEARAAYDKAVLKKSGASSYMGRAIARARSGDVDGARADAAEARKRRPDVDDMFAEYGLKTEAELNVASR